MPRCVSEQSSRRVGRSSGLGRSRLALAEPDEVDVARVDHEAGGLAEHEHRVRAIDGIGQQHEPAEEAEIPERLGHDAGARLLASDPLHDEAHGEHELGDEPDRNPNELGGWRIRATSE